MSAALSRTIDASDPAWRWVEKWAHAHDGQIHSVKEEISDQAAELFYGLALDHRSSLLVVEENPATMYKLPELPEGAEFVLVKGGVNWAFALKHGEALWLGHRGFGDDSCVWPATAAEFTAFMAFTTMSAALDATAASPLADAWVEECSRANGGRILSGPDEIGPMVGDLFRVVVMHYHDGYLVVGESPAPKYPWPDLPEGVEFVPIAGSGYQGFALKHGDALWLGYDPADIENAIGVWSATPAEYAAFAAFTS